VLGRGRRGPVRSAVRTVRIRARSGPEVFGVAADGGDERSPSPPGREHSRELGDVVQQGRCRRRRHRRRGKSGVHQSEFTAHRGERDGRGCRKGWTAERHQRGMVLAERLFENTGKRFSLVNPRREYVHVYICM